jgi:hypothetical protein
VANAVGKEGCDEATYRVTSEPEACPCGNFVSRIPTDRQYASLVAESHNVFANSYLPGTCDEEKCGSDCGFDHAKEKPHSNQATVVATSRCESHNSTPNESIDCKILRNWKPSDQESGGVLPKEIPKVEDTRDPGVLLAFEVLWKSSSTF